MLKLFKRLKPYAAGIVLVFILLAAHVIADLLLPRLMSEVVDKGVMNGDKAFILRTGGIMLLVAAAALLSSFLSSFVSGRVASFFGRDLRRLVFSKVESFSPAEFDLLGTDTLFTRATNDVTQLQQVTVMMLRMFIMSPFFAIGGIVMAFRTDRPLTLVFLVSVPVLLLAIVLLSRLAIPLFKSRQAKIDKLNLILREGLSGMRVIRAFNREGKEKARFEEANADITATMIKVNRIMAFLMPVVMIIMNVTILSVIWFGVGRIDSGGMGLGSLIAFTQYAMHIMFSFVMMSMIFVMVPQAQAAAERINEVLAVEPSIKDPERPKEPENLHGDVEFRDVSFSYRGAEKPALANITFHAKSGETTAIIGSTGSGKSTLVKLVPRFYDVGSGSILVNGVDVREMSQKRLRSLIGYVPQKAALFSGTINDNIRFGAPDADEETVHEAARIAQAEDFIASFEGGFDHVIAQGGVDVSGGQKQRLSIARALARKPQIYIFDDSFSALDFKTDAKLRAAIKDRLADATILLVAQRVGTVMDADRIIVLEEGRIVGAGKHRELLSSCPVYREIAASQLSEEEIA